VAKIVRGIPHTRENRGRQLYDFVLTERATNCLELGVAHGVGSVWIAAALDELGGDRRLVAVDNESALEREPRADQLLEQAGLRHLVELHYHPHSYNWHLLRRLPEYQETFDLVFLDGAHDYEIDGCALYFIRRILREGGWLLLDDLDWSYDSSPALRGTAMVQAMPHDIRTEPHLRLLWEGMVLTDPCFERFIEDGDWGWARKGGDTDRDRSLTIRRDHLEAWRRWLGRAMRKLRR